MEFDFTAEYDGIDERIRHRKMQPKPKKKVKKANHKHNYESVVLEYHYDNWLKNKTFYQAGRRCTICGKLNYNFLKETIDKANELGIKKSINLSDDSHIKDIGVALGLDFVEVENIMQIN